MLNTIVKRCFTTSLRDFSKYTLPYKSPLNINSSDFSNVANKLRNYFLKKGFVEVHTQNRLSILSACEDPFTVSTFEYAGHKWPLPQTGQMWLEYELLKNPSVPGYFCVSTSYRNEPHPIEGRHLLCFPMFEFEMKGDKDDMIAMEKDLLSYLGYNPSFYQENNYNSILNQYKIKEIENGDENMLCKQNPVFFLTDFPEFTHPFWNMKRDKVTGKANKVDVLLSGHETIGSAERETDKDEMMYRFDTILNGAYKERLYSLFGKARTDAELNEFMEFDFFERSGGGIGLTRLIHSMKKEHLLN